MTRPSARTTVAPITYSAVTPYLTHRIPPELQATFPPIVDISRLAGSGGYMRPCSLAARSRLAVITPAPAVATVLGPSISSLVSRSRLITTPPAMGTGPPTRLVPLPPATTGPRWAAHSRTTAAT